MLLLIGLQSGKGLHPDRTFKLPELPRLPKIAEIGSSISSCSTKQPGVKVLNCHSWQFWQFWQFFLPLSLFVFRVFADHTHHALAVHDLALVANLLY